jgi:competence protein ComEC
MPVAWTYADFAGGGGSTVRAAWMISVALVARAIGRRTDPVRAFGLSVSIMALLDPLIAFDLSFALSAAATGGLLVFARPLSERFAGCVPGYAAPAAAAAATTVAASIPCLPIIARFAPRVPVGGVLANLLAVPLGECAALPLCFAHALLGWWPAAERGCAVVASGALVLVRAIARGFAVPELGLEVPQPTSWQFAVLVVMGAALLLRRGARAAVVALCTALVVTLEIGAHRAGAPRALLRATFFDVGQGDSALVDLPDGSGIVVDGGGLVGSPIDVGARVLAPELRARRRQRLSAAVLTHPHPDHYSGLVAGLEAVRVSAFWDTGQGEREGVGGGYASIIDRARRQGVAILRPDSLCGSHIMGGARVEVLAPCPGFSSERGPNDNSFVLRVAFGARAFLLVGDAEREEEGMLLASAGDRLHADVLKVGHHGSRTSTTPAFVSAVSPREAIVSVGCRNRFGHPNEGTLHTLTAAGARVWRTDRDGAITVTTDGQLLEVEAMASQ